MTDKELADMLKSTHYKYPNTFLGSAELVTIGHICKLAAERIEHLQSENTRLKAERDAAVALHKDSAKELCRIFEAVEEINAITAIILTKIKTRLVGIVNHP